ncbi:MAG: hypothetical protein WAU70_15580 [Flavobacteriales bacterium]
MDCSKLGQSHIMLKRVNSRTFEQVLFAPCEIRPTVHVDSCSMDESRLYMNGTIEDPFKTTPLLLMGYQDPDGLVEFDTLTAITIRDSRFSFETGPNWNGELCLLLQLNDSLFSGFVFSQ